MAATATIEINCSSTYTKPTALGTGTISPRINYLTSLSSSDVTKVYFTSATISGVTTLDVTALTDIYGTALSYGTVKGVYIENSGAGNLVLGGGTNPLFGTDQYTVKTGAVLPIVSPFTVGGSNKVITLTPSASLTYSIIIVGS